MDSQNQSSQKFLVFQDKAIQKTDGKSPHLHSDQNVTFCSDRLVLMEKEEENDGKDGEFLRFNAFDLLMNEERSLVFPNTLTKNSHPAHIFPFNNEFLFIVTKFGEKRRVNFVKIDWDSNEFKLIEFFDYDSKFLLVIVDKMEPSKFVIKMTKNWHEKSYQKCKLIKEKIEFEEIYESDLHFDFYSKNRLIQVCENDLLVYYFDEKKEEPFQIESQLNENVKISAGCYCEFINDRIFVSVQKQDTLNYTIIWTDFKIKRWNLFDFETNLPIQHFVFFEDKLIVNAQKILDKENEGICESEVKIYAIEMRRPNPLRYSAWLLVVKIMKEKEEKDPYQAAKEFLPLNSDLREMWFKDEEKQ